MKRIIRWLVPKEDKLFDMLIGLSENAFEAAKELKIFLDEYQKLERKERKAKAQLFKQLQQKADELRSEILHKISKGFLDQNDKEFIRDLAVLLHDIADLMAKVALRFVLLSIERIDHYINKLLEKILSIAEEINKSILSLKKTKDAKEQTIKIKSAVTEAFQMHSEAVSELFHFYKNSLDIIKYNEIYGLFERIICKCEDVGNVIDLLAAKNA